MPAGDTRDHLLALVEVLAERVAGGAPRGVLEPTQCLNGRSWCKHPGVDIFKAGAAVARARKDLVAPVIDQLQQFRALSGVRLK